MATTINNPRGFKVLRADSRRGPGSRRWSPLPKGVATACAGQPPATGGMSPRLNPATNATRALLAAALAVSDLPRRMKQIGLTRFEECMEDFRRRFNEHWLWSD